MILFLRFYFRQSGSRYYLCSLLRVSKTCRVSLVWAWWLHSLKPGLIPDLTLVASVEMHREKQGNICSCCPASQFLNPPCQHVMQWVLGLAPLWAHHMRISGDRGDLWAPDTPRWLQRAGPSAARCSFTWSQRSWLPAPSRQIKPA